MKFPPKIGQARYSDARHASILDAALRCFAARGVIHTTIEDIRQESGASVGSIYHHFESKEAIAATAYLYGLNRYQSSFVEELNRHTDVQSGVRAMVAFHVDWCAANPELTSFLLTSRSPEVIRETAELAEDLNRYFLESLQVWWRPHVHYGSVRDIDMQLCLALWLGPAMEFCRYSLAQASPARRRNVKRVLADAAWQSLEKSGPA